jgi:hypothetical protein
MTLIAFPLSLPAIRPGSFRARSRLASGDLPGPVALRRRFEDAAGSEFNVSWSFTPAQMTVFRAWYEDTLLDGELWFAVSLPGRGGFSTRIARFMEMEQQRIDAGQYNIQATLELRGRAALVQR